MTKLTDPLRAEHATLLPHIEALRTVADSVGAAPVLALRHGVDEAYAFLAHHLLPHANAEDVALYPVVARLMGSGDATATMRRDHVEVDRLTSELGDLRAKLSGGEVDDRLARNLRRVLYGLYALVKVHFAKEEEIYLPILEERLTPAEADELFKAMHDAADAAGAHA